MLLDTYGAMQCLLLRQGTIIIMSTGLLQSLRRAYRKCIESLSQQMRKQGILSPLLLCVSSVPGDSLLHSANCCSHCRVHLGVGVCT